MEGENFLKNKFSNLHTSPEVVSAIKRTEKRTAEKVSQKPTDRIGNYLDRLQEVVNMPDSEEKERKVRMFKHLLFKENIISEENIPERVYELEQEMAFNQGNGHIEITEEYKSQKNAEIISGQKKSLAKWINYLSSDDAMYPMWTKYWALQSVLKVGRYNKKKKAFEKRGKNSAAPFPPMNAGAVAKSIAVIQEKIKDGKIENFSNLDVEEFQNILNKEDFSKIYALALESLPEFSEDGLENTKGEWVVYKQISYEEKDEQEIHSQTRQLFDSLQGYPLEWCTAQNIDMAETQLKGGDFHVYYSEDAYGENKIPRIAIRMQGDDIAEARGIEANQEMDRFVLPVVEEKMDRFGNRGERYKKRTEDMKKLTGIYNKSFSKEDKKTKEKEYLNPKLSKEELVFLYEFNSEITGFGYNDDGDPRINELLTVRDFRKDMYHISGELDDRKVFIYLLNSNFNGLTQKRVKLFEIDFDEINEDDINNLNYKDKLIAQKASSSILLKVANGMELSSIDLRIIYSVDFMTEEVSTFDGILEKETVNILQKRDLKNDLDSIFKTNTESRLTFLATKRDSYKYRSIINEQVQRIYDSWTSDNKIASTSDEDLSKSELSFLYSLNQNSSVYEYYHKVLEIVLSRNSIQDSHKLYPFLNNREQIPSELIDKYKDVGLLDVFEVTPELGISGDSTEKTILNKIENHRDIPKAEYLYLHDLHKEFEDGLNIIFNIEKYNVLKLNKKNELEIKMLALKMLDNIKNTDGAKEFEIELITDLSKLGMLDLVIDNIFRFKSLESDEVIEHALEYPGGRKIYNILEHINISESKLLTILLNGVVDKESEVLKNIDRFSISNSKIFNIFIKYFSKRKEGYIYMEDLMKLLKTINVSTDLIAGVFSDFYIRTDNFPGQKGYARFLDIVEKQGHNTLDLTKKIIVQSKYFDASYIMESIDTGWHNEIAHELIRAGKISILKDQLSYFNSLDKFVYDSLVEYSNGQLEGYKHKFTHLNND